LELIICLLDVLKNDFSEVDERDNSWCRKFLRFHFVHPAHRWKLLGRSCLSDVLSRRMVLRTHKMSSGRLKKGLWWSMKRYFRVSVGNVKSFSASWSSINLLGRSRLSYVLSGRMDLRSRRSNVSSFRKTITTHFLHYGNRKKRLGRCRLSDVSIRQMILRTHICLLNVLKCDFGDVHEAMFHDVERP
jgi:hypothetical protein